MPTQARTQKVQLSFSNWVLGGSLVSLTTTETDTKRSSSSRKVVVVEVDSDGNEVPAWKHTGEKKEDAKKDDDANKAKGEGGKGEKGGKKPEQKEKLKHTCNHQLEEDKYEAGDKNDNSKKDDGDKSNEVGNNSNGGWSEDQDKKIREMKADNKSWKDIAAAVGATRKDVTARFKVLQKDGQGGGDAGKEKKGENSGGEGGTVNDDGLEDFSGLFGGGDEGREAMEATNNVNDNQNQKQGGGNGGKQGSGEKGKGNKQQQEQNQGGYQMGGNKGGSTGRAEEEKSKGRLQADHIWNREDCEILEYLGAKYEEHKWLHLQAGFFNWTGRMVIAELIERKFKDDGVA